jgi:hypothetical protein
MLGAGFVTRPTLDILSEAGIPVTVGMLVQTPPLTENPNPADPCHPPNSLPHPRQCRAALGGRQERAPRLARRDG